jgi:hypothetical protein
VRSAEKRYISRVDSREQLAVANEKIAQLESHLALLKRGFDPPPLTNPISEEQHREQLVLSGKTRVNVPMPAGVHLLIVTLVTLAVGAYAFVFWTDDSSSRPTVGPISSYAKLHGPPVSPVTAGPPRPKSSTSP